MAPIKSSWIDVGVHKARDLALHTFGTAAIFERRAQATARKLRTLAFLGLVVPVTIGGLVGAFGAKFAGLEVVLVVGGLVGTAQIIWSLWALVARWDDALAYARESQTENLMLSKRFDQLALSANKLSEEDFEARMQLLEVENDAREAQDNKHDPTPEEHRLGMRAGLRQFKRACHGCKQVPVDMEPSNCGVCGNF